MFIRHLDHRLLHLHFTRLSIRTVHSSIATEISQIPTVTTITPSRSLSVLATEVNTLAPFPALNAKEEKHCLDKDNSPLPRDTAVLENTVVDNRDVDNREGKNEAGHDTKEKELVAPDIMHPLGKDFLRVGLHLEEAAAQMHHLPGEEEGEPSHAGKGSGAGAEHCVTVIGFVGVVVMCVAALG